MPENNMWGANPELYAKLSEPLDSPRHAQATAKAFTAEVAALREKHHIPELILQFIVYCKPEEADRDPNGDDSVLSLQGGAGWGDQTKQLRLAKLCLDRELESLVDMLAQLANAGIIAASQLITEPTPRKTDG